MKTMLNTANASATKRTVHTGDTSYFPDIAQVVYELSLIHI